MGTMWPHWRIHLSVHPSVHPSLPSEPFLRAARHKLESKGNISVVASGCSWLPPFPCILGAHVLLGLPQLLTDFAFSSPDPLSSPHGSLSRARSQGIAFPVCVHSWVMFVVLCLGFVVC